MADGLFVIVDGHYYAYRYFFGGASLNGPEGRPTGVTFAFAELFTALRRDPQVTHLALVLDHHEPCFRHHLFPDYKAHRDPMPDALKRQLPDVTTIATAMAVPYVIAPGYEADDAIATMARTAAADGLQVRICTRDKDIDQVLGPTISTWDPHTGLLRGPEQVRAERGVDCHQIIDYLTMIGDSADNVPGIRGVGPKTAAQLLARYGDLAGVYAQLDDLRGKQREHVAAFTDLRELVRELITIVDVPELPPTAHFQKRAELPAAATEVLVGFGFSVARFADPPRVVTAAAGARYARLAGAEVCATCDRLRLARSTIAIAVARNDDGSLHGLAVASDPDQRQADHLQLDDPAARRAVFDLLADPAVPLIVCESSRVLAALRRDGAAPSALAGDPSLAAWLLDPDRASESLAALLRHHFDEQLEIERDPVLAACTEAQCVLRLDQVLRAELERAGLGEHYRQLELPTSAALAAASAAGIVLDRQALDAHRDELDLYLRQVVTELRSLAGEGFNPASPLQVAKLLYQRLELPVPRRTRNGPSVDDEALESLRCRHEAADLILQFRQLSRLLGDALGRLGAAMDPLTGRIHPRWDQRGSDGALRCDGCDLSALPGRGQLGRELRGALRSAPGHELVAVRLPHLQLHLLAWITADPELAAALAEDADPHRAIAARLHRCEPAAIGPGERRVAFELHRALIEGASVFALAQRLGVPRGEAESLLAEHAALFPTTAAHLDQLAETASRCGQARTLGGRPRRLGLDANPTDALRARRAAIAWIVVGSTAELIKRALVQAHAGLATAVLPLDDGLAVEIPADDAERAAAMLTDALSQAWPASPPPSILHPSPEIQRGPSMLAVG